MRDGKEDWNEEQERKAFEEEIQAFRRDLRSLKKSLRPSKAPSILRAIAALVIGGVAGYWDMPQPASSGQSPPVSLAAIAFGGPDLSGPIAEFIDWARAPERTTSDVVERLDSEPVEMRRALVGVALAALRSSDSREQVEALALIERTFPDDPGIDALALRFATESARADARVIAIGLMARRANHAANLDRLVQLISRDSDQRTPQETHVALLALAENAHTPARVVAGQLLEDGSPLVAMGAAAVLDALGDARGMVKLLELARRSDDLDASLQSMRYLWSHHREEAETIVIEWLRDPDSPDLKVSWATRLLKGF